MSVSEDHKRDIGKKLLLRQKCHKCLSCNLSFVNLQGLIKHKKKHNFTKIKKKDKQTEVVPCCKEDKLDDKHLNVNLFYCNECSRSYSDLLELQIHLENSHFPSKVVISDENQSISDCNCSDLVSVDKNQSIDKIKKKKTGHGRCKQKNVLKNDGERNDDRLECTDCGKLFMHSFSLGTHRRKFHGVYCRQTVKCPLANCDYFCAKLTQLINHLNSNHKQNIQIENLWFPGETEYSTWLSKVEQETPCNFLRDKETTSPSSRTSYYYCNRSGRARPAKVNRSSDSKRLVKAQGSCKIRRTCPAHFIKYVNSDGTATVRYVSKHFCFTNRLHQLGHIRLSKQDKEWVAEKLSKGSSVVEILREARCEPVSGFKMSRRHLLTPQDVRNITKAFKISQPLSTDTTVPSNDDEICLSVEDLVRNFDGDHNSPILLYKGQKTAIVDICCGSDSKLIQGKFLESDFFFAYSNSTQREILTRCGNGPNSVVCIDLQISGNGEFWFMSISVLDGNKVPLPAAFLLSNHQSQDITHLFFASVWNKCGVLNCKVLLTKPLSHLYSIWTNVMGSNPCHLFYTHQIDLLFKEQAKKLIKGNQDCALNIYQQLKELIEEADINSFQSHLDTFLSELDRSPFASEFAAYFRENFIDNVTSWATCYWTKFGIDMGEFGLNKMKLEQYDCAFKQISILTKRCNSGWDAIVWALVGSAQDHQFDQLITACKGKVGKRLNDVQTRHKSSLELSLSNVYAAISGNQWFARSESFDFYFYIIRKIKDNCSCTLMCSQCQACLHMFSCSCPDNSEQFNMCSHIHLVCMWLKLPDSDERKSSINEDVDNCSQPERGNPNSSDARDLFLQLCDSADELKDKANYYNNDVTTLGLVLASIKSMINMVESRIQISKIVTSGNNDDNTVDNVARLGEQVINDQYQQINLKGVLLNNEPLTDERVLSANVTLVNPCRVVNSLNNIQVNNNYQSLSQQPLQLTLPLVQRPKILDFQQIVEKELTTCRSTNFVDFSLADGSSGIAFLPSTGGNMTLLPNLPTNSAGPFISHKRVNEMTSSPATPGIVLMTHYAFNESTNTINNNDSSAQSDLIGSEILAKSNISLSTLNSALCNTLSLQPLSQLTFANGPRPQVQNQQPQHLAQQSLQPDFSYVNWSQI